MTRTRPADQVGLHDVVIATFTTYTRIHVVRALVPEAETALAAQPTMRCESRSKIVSSSRPGYDGGGASPTVGTAAPLIGSADRIEAPAER